MCLFCSLAVFIPSTEPLRLPRRRGLLEFRGRDVQFLRQWQRRLSLQRGRFGRWRQRRGGRRRAGAGQTPRRPRRDRTGLWTQTPSNRLHSRNRPADRTRTPALAAFNVLTSVLYIFLFPPSLLCLLVHATSFFCSAYKPFCIFADVKYTLRWMFLPENWTCHVINRLG